MPAEWWFFVFGEEPVGPAKSGRQARLVHIGSNLLASWDTAEIRATPSDRGLTGVVRGCDFPAEYGDSSSPASGESHEQTRERGERCRERGRGRAFGDALHERPRVARHVECARGLVRQQYTAFEAGPDGTVRQRPVAARRST